MKTVIKLVNGCHYRNRLGELRLLHKYIQPDPICERSIFVDDRGSLFNEDGKYLTGISQGENVNDLIELARIPGIMQLEAGKLYRNRYGDIVRVKLVPKFHPNDRFVFMDEDNMLYMDDGRYTDTVGQPSNEFDLVEEVSGR